jgi:hypothetical protein
LPKSPELPRSPKLKSKTSDDDRGKATKPKVKS